MAPEPNSPSDHGMDLEGSAEPSGASARSASPETSQDHMSKDKSGTTKKRSGSNVDSSSAAAHKVTKRRAARACVSCRARKVRCDVVEGAPCGNCRWDNVECIVQESRRRKKHLFTPSLGNHGTPFEAQQIRAKSSSISSAAAANPANIHSNSSSDSRRRRSTASGLSPGSLDMSSLGVGGVGGEGGSSGNASSRNNSSTPLLPHNMNMAGLQAAQQARGMDNHVPHMIYQRSGYHLDSSSSNQSQTQSSLDANANQNVGATSRVPWTSLIGNSGVFADARTAHFLGSLEDIDAGAQLPPFVRPLPRKIDAEDIRYLHAKGALALPSIPLQNALLQAYAEHVHPYMPLMDLHDFFNIVNHRDGLNGQTSLFLYQAVMFSATAFVDLKLLREEGYPTRKSARKGFFQKTRLLYDFDYESDRLVLVQGLLLMTYWYETPDDQKDTWHWMGVAISLAHTIGLHRNPEHTCMAPSRKKLWKRIWWSCFMRDRLVALGMRRPTRIKDEDFDVPMLVESDFEIQPLHDSNTVVPRECTLMRDVGMQRELAVMCIAKAQLCVHISQMLKAQYSVLIRDNMKPENTTNSTMMLFPNKTTENVDMVRAVDASLREWHESLPSICQYRALTPFDVQDGRSTLAVQRTLLHMVYYTTISALHRPQFLPSPPAQGPLVSPAVQEMSRLRVRDAAMHITSMAAQLQQLRLERFLPTTGVTVILPAMIMHLLEMKSPSKDARERAMRGFRHCMRVMEKLREVYAAADYATGFLDAALRKAAIDINPNGPSTTVGPSALELVKRAPMEFSAQTPPPENAPYMTATETMFNEKAAIEQQRIATSTVRPSTLESSIAETSPPQTDFESSGGGLTPGGSAGSDEANPLDMDAMDVDFMQGHDEFDWNAVAGTDFDVDQWLQFPPEGVSNTDESLMAGVLGNSNNADAGQDLSWLDGLGSSDGAEGRLEQLAASG